MIKKSFISLSLLSLILTSCQIQEKKEESSQIDETVSSEHFYNPILSGFYPDPSICRVDEDYYLINSTFVYFPAIPVFHSKDLVNWTQIGHVLDRNEQIDLAGLGVSRGIFAPAISHHNGIFYVVCTLVDGGGNFIVYAHDPAGPWSNPIWLPEVSGIDPSLFFDDDKTYLVYNSEPPNNEAQYDGHRTIKMLEFNEIELKCTSLPKIIINGGTDLSKKPVWIEGPHIYKIGEYYYLLAAEGGTSFEHSAVIFRSKEIWGPYESFSGNPILTQRHLSQDRSNPVACTGHADMVQTKEGDWWAVFLGTRPYDGRHFNIGRETFLAPVFFNEGWPIIDPENELVQFKYEIPKIEKSSDSTTYLNGNFEYKDNFDSLHMSWTFLRNPVEDWYGIEDGMLWVNVREQKVSGVNNPSFIAQRQKYHYGETSTKMTFDPEEDEQAGLILFQNEKHYYYFCVEKKNETEFVSLYRCDRGNTEILFSDQLEGQNADPIIFKVKAKGKVLDFIYQTDQAEEKILGENVDARILSTESAGGFVGVMQALYATGPKKSSETKAYFDWFEMKVQEEVYNK